MSKKLSITEQERDSIKSLYGIINEIVSATTTTTRKVVQQYDFYTIDAPIKSSEFLDQYIAQLQEKGLIGDSPDAIDFYDVKKPFVAKNILGQIIKYLPGQKVRFNL